MTKTIGSRFVVMLWVVAMVFSAMPVTALRANAAVATDGALSYLIGNGTAIITKCDSNASGNMEIPATLGGCPVSAVAGNAFKGCDKLTNITLPDSIVNIEAGAFKNCSNLSAISLPASITAIKSDTFYGCTNLTSITIPNGVTSIGERAFLDCKKMESITIPPSVSFFGYYAFCYCTALENVYISDVAKWCEIRTDKHYNAYSSPLNYAENLYLNGRLVTDLVIPYGTTRIDERAFMNCKKLTHVVIPESVTSIGSDAFVDCTSLTSVSIPNSVTKIGNGAFRGCSNLTSVSIPDSITTMGSYAFKGCTSLTSIIIPGSAFAIGTYAGCSGLSTVIIGDGATQIPSEAFIDCYSLTNITIPDSVTQVYSNSFNNCYSLSNVYFGGSQKRWDAIEIGSGNEALTSATVHCAISCNDGHQWNNSKVTKAATCKEEGIRTYACSNCGDTKTESIPKLTTHTWDSGKVTKEATCEEEGVKTYTCTACGATKNEDISAKGHTEVVDAAVVATCTENGLSEGKHCSVCSKVLTAQTKIPAKGHTDANTDFLCDTCGSEICTNHTEETNPGMAATCLEDGLTEGKKCTSCGIVLVAQEVIPATGHSYGEWTQSKAPTTGEPGLEERVCANCGDTEQRETAKLEPEPTDPKPNEPTPTEPSTTAPTTRPGTEPSATSPTGSQTPDDNGNPTVVIIVIVAVVAAGGAAALIVLKKKK